MEIEVLSKDSKSIELRIRGEGHTLLNMLVDELNKDPHVSYAAYSVDHPLIDEARLIIVTDGSVNPFEALKKAVNNLKDLLKDLRVQVIDAIRGAEEKGS